MLIALCDDDTIWMKDTRVYMDEYFQQQNQHVDILCFKSGQELLAYQDHPVDAVFLDIEMGEENGIHIASLINREWKDCQVIYCTNHMHYAMDIYDTRYSDYLVKSQMEDRLDSIMNKLLRIKCLETLTATYHVISEGEKSFLVKDILFFERQTRFTRLETEQGSYRISEKITQVMTGLPEGMFTRCHAAFTMNLDKVAQKYPTYYELKNGEKLPISRSFAQNTKDDYLRWCADQIR